MRLKALWKIPTTPDDAPSGPSAHTSATFSGDIHKAKDNIEDSPDGVKGGAGNTKLASVMPVKMSVAGYLGLESATHAGTGQTIL